MAQFSFVMAAAALILVQLLPSSAPDIQSDRSALLALRAAVGGGTLSWNTSRDTPCSWPGVKCSPENSSVVELRLPGKSLSGHLPPHTITNITTLRTLSLRCNSLSGPLPAELFTSLTSLRNLYLHQNFFTGEIPDSLFSLTSIVHLNLADNNLSGGLSPFFNNMTRLEMLYLENNHFSGPVPTLNSPNLVKFNVSNNDLSGRIPRGLSGKPKSSFIGNSLCGNPLDSCANDKKLSRGLIAGIVSGSVLGFLFVVLLVLCWYRKLARKGVNPVNEHRADKEVGSQIPGSGRAGTSRGFATSALVDDIDVISSSKKELVFFGETMWNFDLEDLMRASAEVLGKGAYGTSYKAVLERGQVVVVKRMKELSVGEEIFRQRMEEVGRMDHENLVPLKGYYSNLEEKLLVYEYLPMGSLSALLHGEQETARAPLNWEKRVAIARGVVRGILHLHSELLSHGNIKSSNILLTKSYEAHVSDFGLASLALPAATTHHVFAYRAPEVTNPCKISQKADVYSVGVLLLELLSGKAPTHSLLSEEWLDLPRWVQSVAWDEWATKVFDLELQCYQNVEEDMVHILQLALSCTEQNPDERPTMVEVTNKIEEVCSWSF